MNEKQFDELLMSVRDMGRHMRGEAVAGLAGDARIRIAVLTQGHKGSLHTVLSAKSDKVTP